MEIDESENPLGIIIIGHGAGAGMHHPFMVELARLFSSNQFHAVRFNFPYMEAGRKSPGSPKKNIETWRLVAEHIHSTFPALPIFLSGKSYGGRMASHLLSDQTPQNVKGIIYFGFPLHAPGKDSKDRAAHLNLIKLPQLFIQGTNDKLANIDLIEQVIVELDNSTIDKIESADHSFNVPKKIGISKSEILNRLVDSAVSFQKNNL